MRARFLAFFGRERASLCHMGPASLHEAALPCCLLDNLFEDIDRQISLAG